jgi:hypothetical protein
VRPLLVKNIFLWLLVILFPAERGYAQFYETGQAPASLQWEQIRTANFRIIFPRSFAPRALELARLLEDAHELAGYSLSHQPDPVPVIVHNHNIRSNGLVAWAPKRMELYTTYPQSIRGGDWLTQLVVHEQRHVVQIDKLNQGVLRVLSLLLGEQAVGISTGRIPGWFYEGDAVVAETALTPAGRGRTPSFYMPMRALLLNRTEFYSYDKYLHGSFRDYVPDRYQYGYRMVSELRKGYGQGIWENVIDYTARRPYYLAPFYRSLRHDTGMGMSSLHDSVVSVIRDEWQALHRGSDFEVYDKLNRREDSLYLNYRYPIWAGDSAVVALKSGIAQIDELVKVDLEGNEKSIFYPGPLSSPTLAISGNLVAWSEFQPDLRWRLASYSVIRVLDLETGQAGRISSRSRYFSPAFSPGGHSLAVVETDNANNDHLVLLDPATGREIAAYPAQRGKNLQQPVFGPDGNRIMVTAVCIEGTSILSLDTRSGAWTTLREPSMANISGVFPCGELVCFHSDFSGIDNLYAMDEKEGTHYTVTLSASGAFDGALSASGNNLAWSDYTINGFDLASSPFDTELLRVRESKEYFRDELAESLMDQEKGVVSRRSGYDTTGWEIRPYRERMNLFRFHSWSPFYYDYNDLNIEELPVSPGITLLSQNSLNTANTFIGYSYRNGHHVASGSFIYKGWYPVFEAAFDYGDEPQVFMGRDTIGPLNTASPGRLNLNGTVSLPLNLSSGRYIAGFRPMLRVNYNNSLFHYDQEDIYERGMITLATAFFAYRYSRRSLRDLAPGWGQVLTLRRSDAPFETENLGSISSAELTLYFPGMLPHHSLRITGALQRQAPVKYYYANHVRLPRGYAQEPAENLQLVKGSYSFPFLYPDISVPLPGVIYLKRFHAELFAETGVNIRRTGTDNGTGEWENETLFSWGTMVTTNFHVLRAPFPINLGAGLAHIPGLNELSFLFSFSIDAGSL